jgi:hypothetical protein
MPTDKDFKRLVRGRMQKTGESYTAARAHLLQHQARPARPRPADYATLAGRRDAVVEANTGSTWAGWVRTLDRAGAHAWRHREIAKYLQQQHGLTGWWSQTVTVGYERIKGLRAMGQRLDGSFEVNKSKTLKVPVARLYHAFHDPRLRAHWLSGADPTLRSSSPEKAIRFTWPDQTVVIVGFTRLGDAKSQVAVQHGKLPDRAAAARLRQYWTERLDALAGLLSAGREP